MFKDSCVTAITPWSVREEATLIPTHILPAYIGSGKAVLSLDASGLQGLNNRMQEAYVPWPHVGDLYFIQNGMTGNQVSPDNVLPLGYLEWEMQLDGAAIGSENLQQHAAVWEREIRIDEARVLTRMRLENRLALEIAAWMPHGSSSPVFEITLQGFPYMGAPVKDTRDVRFMLRLQLKSRQGQILPSQLRFDGEALNAEFAGHECYRRRYRLSNSRDLRAEYEDGQLSVTWAVQVGAAPERLTCVLAIDDPFTAADTAALSANHQQEWRAYYARLAEIEGLDVQESFLLHNSLYLLHAGFDYDLGISIGAPFFFPPWWKASVFWDSNQIIDGLMKAGDKEDAYRLLRFLQRTMRPAGKPWPWMMQYDGTVTIDDARDIAPLVIAAHAATAIKTYEYFRDDELLAQVVYPLCKRAGDYALESLFRPEDGRWMIAAPVSNDVVDEVPDEINQTYTTLWFLVVLRKTVEYARLLGRREELDQRYEQILQNPLLEQTGEEYLQSRGVTAAACRWASWLPFLLYPTEAMPFVDMALFERTRQKYDFVDLYMEKQGCYQPWTCFMQAASDARRPAPEDAYEQMQEGLKHVFGPGYFCEVGPRQQTGTVPPYISAHGAYIAALYYQFIADSIWDKRLAIFAGLPRAYASRQFRLRDVQCFGNLRVDCGYKTHEVWARVRGSLTGYELSLPVPPALTPEQLRVTVNGTPAEHWFSADRLVHLKIEEDLAEYEISLR